MATSRQENSPLGAGETNEQHENGSNDMPAPIGALLQRVRSARALQAKPDTAPALRDAHSLKPMAQNYARPLGVPMGYTSGLPNLTVSRQDHPAKTGLGRPPERIATEDLNKAGRDCGRQKWRHRNSGDQARPLRHAQLIQGQLRIRERRVTAGPTKHRQEWRTDSQTGG